MSQKLTLQQLESFLLEAANILRDSLAPSELKDYIFGIMFLKRISDVFEEEQEKVIQSCLYKGKTPEQAKALADDKHQYSNAFYIPKSARWPSLKNIKHDIGESLNKAIATIEEHNSVLEGVWVTTDFKIKTKFTDAKLRSLLSHFDQHRLGNEDLEYPELLGEVYEQLIKTFADKAGTKGGEFYTPSEVSQLLVALLKPRAGMSIYDPTAGSGSMLLQARKYLAINGENVSSLSLFGQELSPSTWAVCKMNMFLHEVQSADIRMGDSLREPKHIHDDKMMSFDRVIANPPFSLRDWGKDECDKDIFERFPYGTPPKNAGDLAFVQHMIASANNDGIVGVVIPHGILFRGASERRIRQGMLADDLVEAVIGLPSGLLYGTTISMCLLILNKKKEKSRKNKVIFIDASHHFESTPSMNKIRQEDILRVVDAFDKFESIGTFSKVVDVGELVANDASLKIKRYIDDSPIVREMEELLKHHEGFERISLGNDKLVRSVKVVKKVDEEIVPNSIYLTRYRPHKEPIKIDLTELDTNNVNFIRVEFCKEKLINEYAKLFFESNLGRLMLRSIPTGASIQMLQAKSIQSLSIPLPSTTEQTEVIKVASKLQLAKQQIDTFFSKLTTEPKQYQEIEDKTDSMVYTLSRMTDAKHVQHLISFGETRQMEFKQSFFANADVIYSDNGKLAKDRDVQGEVIKDIASFMNTEGGTLLIGVNDKGKVIGIDREMKRCGWKKVDNYFQELGAQLESRLVRDYHQYCRLTEINIDEKTVARIDCTASPSPVFLDNEKFHVRTDTSSPALTGQEMLRYIQNHFKVALLNER
ncbi:N-6 DNA methylase [Vibrio sp. SCSIO 43086]|uniref:N-6 DNA methylase n=1 Tax=Vibrio sp. SCSIO 43086 TaxID=2822845 RepID=UPI003DA9D9D3